MKVVKSIILFLLASGLICSIGCTVNINGSSSERLVGYYYDEDDRCLEVRSDYTWVCDWRRDEGSWRTAGEYGTVEFFDGNGNIEDVEAGVDRYGGFIKLDDEYYYKNEYPSNIDD